MKSHWAASYGEQVSWAKGQQEFLTFPSFQWWRLDKLSTSFTHHLTGLKAPRMSVSSGYLEQVPGSKLCPCPAELRAQQGKRKEREHTLWLLTAIWAEARSHLRQAWAYPQTWDSVATLASLGFQLKMAGRTGAYSASITTWPTEIDLKYQWIMHV